MYLFSCLHLNLSALSSSARCPSSLCQRLIDRSCLSHLLISLSEFRWFSVWSCTTTSNSPHDFPAAHLHCLVFTRLWLYNFAFNASQDLWRILYLKWRTQRMPCADTLSCPNLRVYDANTFTVFASTSTSTSTKCWMTFTCSQTLKRTLLMPSSSQHTLPSTTNSHQSHFWIKHPLAQQSCE